MKCEMHEKNKKNAILWCKNWLTPYIVCKFIDKK